jgi:hypothetical protein
MPTTSVRRQISRLTSSLVGSARGAVSASQQAPVSAGRVPTDCAEFHSPRGCCWPRIRPFGHLKYLGVIEIGMIHLGDHHYSA